MDTGQVDLMSVHIWESWNHFSKLVSRERIMGLGRISEYILSNLIWSVENCWCHIEVWETLVNRSRSHGLWWHSDNLLLLIWPCLSHGWSLAYLYRLLRKLLRRLLRWLLLGQIASVEGDANTSKLSYAHISVFVSQWFLSSFISFDSWLLLARSIVGKRQLNWWCCFIFGQIKMCKLLVIEILCDIHIGLKLLSWTLNDYLLKAINVERLCSLWIYN